VRKHEAIGTLLATLVVSVLPVSVFAQDTDGDGHLAPAWGRYVGNTPSPASARMARDRLADPPRRLEDTKKTV